MGFIDKYPYTDFHELNLDWILKTIRELGIKMDEFEAVNTITFSGAWDITKQYPAWTVVSDNNIGYISIQPVPSGIVLTNTDYWRVIVDYSAQLAGMQTDIINLKNTVGDASSGLVKQTNDNSSAIGALQTTVGNATSGLVKQTNDNSSAIGALQTTVGNASSGLVKQTNDNSSAISTINNTITNIENKMADGKWLFMGDSYENYGQWYSALTPRLGLTDGVNCFYAGGSGHGFTVSGSEWINDFTAFCTGRTDLSEFKHVVIVGGLNDSTSAALASDGALLKSAIRSFFSTVWQRMPSAVIAFAYVGAGLSDSAYLAGRTAENRFKALEIIKDEFYIERTTLSYKIHGMFLEGPQYAMHSPGYFNADGIHPNSYGAAAIVEALEEAVLRGCACVHGYYKESSSINFGSGHFACFEGFTAEMENGRSKVVMRSVVDQESPSAFTIGTVPYDLGRIPTGIPIYNSEPVVALVQRSNSANYANLQARVQIINGHLFVSSQRLQTGPSYQSLSVSVNDRLDLGDLTFDEFTLFSL